MAIEFNDNIHVKINRPTDFRFGPFNDIAQANSLIPIAQRYHGLIFGIYTTPLDIANSDIDFYYYYDGLTDVDYLPFGGSGKPPIDGDYVDQAAMIAAQTIQSAQYIYYDGTSYWEYLGTTNGDITDYREIGDGGSKWTNIGTDIYRNSKVLIGATTFTDPSAKFEISGRVSQVGQTLSTFFGFEAGLTNSVIGANTAFGHQALKSIVAAHSNSAFGWIAGRDLQNGIENVFVGRTAGVQMTSANYNVFVGAASGYAALSGDQNSTLGYGALFNHPNPNANVAIGFQALLLDNLGTQNTVVGARSTENIRDTVNNSQNVVIGYFAAQAAITMQNSIIIGRNARPNANGQINQIVIGHDLAGNGSNTTTIGNANTTKTFLRGKLQISPTLETPTGGVTNIGVDTLGNIVAGTAPTVSSNNYNRSQLFLNNVLTSTYNYEVANFSNLSIISNNSDSNPCTVTFSPATPTLDGLFRTLRILVTNQLQPLTFSNPNFVWITGSQPTIGGAVKNCYIEFLIDTGKIYEINYVTYP
jgi:hypothetical protein